MNFTVHAELAAILRKAQGQPDETGGWVDVGLECVRIREQADALMALAKLGRWCLDQSREHDSSDVDAASLQDKAIRLGLLAYVEVAEPCGQACHCLEYEGSDGFPTRCLRYTDRAVLDVDR